MANGNFAGGDGTENNPYLIEDAFDLDEMRNNLSAHYELINDIDLDISPFNEDEGWDPIGHTLSSVEKFTGVLNGNGHTISNLFINRPSEDGQGFFGHIEGAEIKNVILKDVDIAGGRDIGGFASRCDSSVIESSCFIGRAVASKSYYIGGIVGLANSSTIKNSYSKGEVKGVRRIGGIVGRLNGSRIINSYSVAKVVGVSEVYGLVGGDVNVATVTNSFWDKNTSGQNSSKAGGIGLTTVEMQNPQTFIDAGWDRELNDSDNPLWKFKDNQYPELNLNIERMLFFSKNSDNLKSVDPGDKRVVDLPNQSEGAFLRHGMTSTMRSPDAFFIKKQCIKNEFRLLGRKKVFEQKLDTNKNIKYLTVTSILV